MSSDNRSRSVYRQLLRDADRHAVWVGLAAMVAIIGFSRGVYVAAIFAVASVVGYLNGFILFRSVIAFFFMRTPGRPNVLLVTFCIFGSAGLLWFGHWRPLVIITMAFILIDAIVLRFRR